jgi:hypothetical protein
MPERSTSEIIQSGRLEEHPAIKAWRVLQPGRTEAQSIEILKERKRKSGVYRLAGVGLGGAAVIAKQCWHETGAIERTMYEAVLPHLPLPHLHYYGFVPSDAGWCWLFFEDAGEERYSPRNEEHRVCAALWLGMMHVFAARVPAASRLPGRGPNYYLARLRSARDSIQHILTHFALKSGDRILLGSLVSQCDLLETQWDLVEKFCEMTPRTVVHGDFVDKNLRIRASSSGITLLPFDWEVAGWGLPAADLTQRVDPTAVSCADADLTAYWSIVQHSWSQLDAHAIGALANLGMIFRLIDAINWAYGGLAYEGSDKYIEAHLKQFYYYQDGMARAIQALE